MTTVLELWRLLDPQQRRQLVLLQLVSLIMAFSTLVGIAAVLPFFTVLAEPQSIGRNAALTALYAHLHFDSERSFMVALGCGFVALVLLANVINLLGFLAMGRFALQVGNSFYIALFAEYLDRDCRFHATANSATLSRNVTYEIGRVIKGILEGGLVLVTNFATIVLIVGSVVVLNPWIASGTFAALGATYVLIYVLARGRLRRNGLNESRFAEERAKVVIESFAAIKEIIVLGGQGYFIDRFARASGSIARSMASTMAIAHSPRHVVECLLVAALVGMALFLSGSGNGIRPWLPQLTFLAFAAYRLLPAVQQAFSSLVRIRAERAAFENIAVDLRRARARNRVVDAVGGRRPRLATPRDAIQLRNVSFRYAADQPLALRDVSLRVPAGAVIGITGANGSGKTTLIDVIAGLLIPETGTMEVDGRAVDDTNRQDWQSAIAYVPQHPYLVDSTLSENIALGVPPDRVDRRRLREAIRLAQLDGCVAGLPNGVDERLGERGARLSGGQRQRIAIARALYRNTSVLVLDEATDSLDVLAEQEVMSAIEGLRGGRTVVMVSHRLSTLRRCDQILELENGEIARSGCWEELIKHSTRFRHAAGLRHAAEATRGSSRY